MYTHTHTHTDTQHNFSNKKNTYRHILMVLASYSPCTQPCAHASTSSGTQHCNKKVQQCTQRISTISSSQVHQQSSHSSRISPWLSLAPFPQECEKILGFLHDACSCIPLLLAFTQILRASARFHTWFPEGQRTRAPNNNRCVCCSQAATLITAERGFGLRIKMKKLFWRGT